MKADKRCLFIDILKKQSKSVFIYVAGIFYGEEGSNYPLPEDLDIDNLKAVFITHAHADHIGRTPLLLEQGYLGPIYMNKTSYGIARVMLESSIKLRHLQKFRNLLE